MDPYDQLLAAIATDDLTEVTRLIQSGLDLNVRCDDGASPIFSAILHGNLSIVELLIENSADPNLIAEEPAAFIYDTKPLELAMGARFIMDWDKYQPIVKMLESIGATDMEGKIQPPDDLPRSETAARIWQAQKAAQERDLEPTAKNPDDSKPS